MWIMPNIARRLAALERVLSPPPREVFVFTCGGESDSMAIERVKPPPGARVTVFQWLPPGDENNGEK